MAPGIFKLLLATFLHLSVSLPTQHDISAPTIVVQPEGLYYVGRKNPARIVCQTRNAEDIVFRCGGTQIPQTSVETDDPIDEGDLELLSEGFHTRASIEVRRTDVISYQKQQKAAGVRPVHYWCECGAIDVNGNEVSTSRRAVIRPAHLRHQWFQEPENALVSAGDNAELMCRPPKGNPKPQISWMKDGERVRSDGRYIVTDHGSLVIRDVRADDAGKYRCVAVNPAGRRESREAQFSVAGLTEPFERTVQVIDAQGSHVEIVKSRAPRQATRTQARFTKEPLKEYLLAQGKDVTIECWTIGLHSLLFKCGGRQVTNGLKEKEQDINGTKFFQYEYKLTYDEAKNITRDRDLSCSCMGWVHNGTAWEKKKSSPDHGKIVFAFMEESFEAEPSDITVQIGTNGLMRCAAPKASPAAFIHWFKDNARVNTRSDKYAMTSTGDLTINNVQRSDEGSYYCQARNKLLIRVSKQAMLTASDSPVATTTAEPTNAMGEINFPAVIPDVPTIVKDFADSTTVGPDGQAEMTCAVVSTLTLTLQCGGSRLNATKGDYTETVKTDPTTQKKMIIATKMVTAEDIASSRRPDQYYCECIAWLYKDDKWLKAQGNKGYVVRPVPEATDAPTSTYLGREFESSPRDVSVMVGDAARLDCQPPRGNPTPRLYWLKDGNRVIPDDVIDIERFTLRIRSTRVTDQGRYECIAENQAGQRASNPATLTVRAPSTTARPTPEPTPVVDPSEPAVSDFVEPIFFGASENMTHYILRNKELALECIVLGSKHVVFECNGEQIDGTVTNRLHQVDPQTGLDTARSEYIVNREMISAYSRENPYTCVCVSEFIDPLTGQWEVIDSESFTIELAYLKKRFTQSPMSIRPTKGGRVVLECDPPAGMPAPEVFWLREDGRGNEERVASSNRVRVQSPGNLVIDDFQDGDEGEYTCVASNIASQRRTASVSVYYDLIVDPNPETDGAGGGVTTGVITDPDQFNSPYFSKTLMSNYYIVKGEPARLLCEVRNSDTISVSCNDRELEPSRVNISMREDFQRGTDDQMHPQRVTTAEFTVTKDQILEAGSENQLYFCACQITPPGNLSPDTTVGYVTVAYIKKEFKTAPVDSRLQKGLLANIACEPEGEPAPTVTWHRADGKLVQGSVMPGGNLIIYQVTEETEGEYYCQATNVAGTRKSDTVRFTVFEADIEGTDEMKRCMEHMNQCSAMKPMGVSSCGMEEANNFKACVDEFEAECVTDNSPPAYQFLLHNRDNIDVECSDMQDCHSQISKCQSNFVDSDNGGAFSVQDFCNYRKSYAECVEQVMAQDHCMVDMVEPEVGIPSLEQITGWMHSFCMAFVEESNSLAGCAKMAECRLDFPLDAGSENATFWCSTISELVTCTTDAVNECSLDELRGALQSLHENKEDIYCMAATAVPEGEGQGEGQGEGSEPEGEGQGASEPEVEPTGEPGTEEGGAAATQQDDGQTDGSQAMGMSLLLTLALQVLVAAFLSQR